VTCFDFQTALPTATGDISNVIIKANTLLTIVLSVTFRWKQWVMFTVICGMGWGETRRYIEILYHACYSAWL